VGSNPIFGELTLHPEAGLGRFKPERMDEILYDCLRHVQNPGSGRRRAKKIEERRIENNETSWRM